MRRPDAGPEPDRLGHRRGALLRGGGRPLAHGHHLAAGAAGARPARPALSGRVVVPVAQLTAPPRATRRRLRRVSSRAIPRGGDHVLPAGVDVSGGAATTATVSRSTWPSRRSDEICRACSAMTPAHSWSSPRPGQPEDQSNGPDSSVEPTRSVNSTVMVSVAIVTPSPVFSSPMKRTQPKAGQTKRQARQHRATPGGFPPLTAGAHYLDRRGCCPIHAFGRHGLLFLRISCKSILFRATVEGMLLLYVLLATLAPSYRPRLHLMSYALLAWFGAMLVSSLPGISAMPGAVGGATSGA